MLFRNDSVVNDDVDDDDEDVNAGHPPEAEHGDKWDKVWKPSRPTRGKVLNVWTN